MDEAKRKALAAALGLPEDATEEQVRAKAKAVRAAADDAGVEDDNPDPGERKPNEQRVGDEPGKEDEPPAHQTPPGTAPSGTASTGAEPGTEDDGVSATVTLDRNTFEHLKKGADIAHANAAEADKKRQAEVVEAAIKAGKIFPARRKHYISLMAMDEAGTTDQLNKLEAGLIPVTERGESGDGDDRDVHAGQGAGLPEDWFPEIAERRARTGGLVTQAKEG